MKIQLIKSYLFNNLQVYSSCSIRVLLLPNIPKSIRDPASNTNSFQKRVIVSKGLMINLYSRLNSTTESNSKYVKC